MRMVDSGKCWDIQIIGAVWKMVAFSGIFPDMGNYVTRQYIGAWQQFFRTFQIKGSRRGKYIKCAEVRTKKGLMTRYRRKGKSLDFPGKTEFVDTIRAQEKSSEKLQKVTQKKNVHQDISDTLKSRLLKNTNVRGLYWILLDYSPYRASGGADRQDTGQAAAVSFIFLAPKKYSELSESLKGI